MQKDTWSRNTPFVKKRNKQFTSKVWTEEEDSLLCKKYYDEGMKIESIVPLLNRNYTSVKARLDFIGGVYLNKKIEQITPPSCDDTLSSEQFGIIVQSFEYIIKSLNSLHTKLDQLTVIQK